MINTVRRKLQTLLLNTIGYIAYKLNFFKHVRIVSPADTLDEILFTIGSHRSGGYLRFGDGDINLMYRKDDLYQAASDKISNEMKMAFNANGQDVYKTLPIHSNKFGYSIGMYPGAHLSDDRWATCQLVSTFKYFIGNKIYSPVALSYSYINDKSRFKKTLLAINQHSVILVANEEIPESLLLNLFSNPVIVRCPKSNAYSSMDEVENILTNEIQNCRPNDYKVIVIAMGCSGRILQARMLQKKLNCFYFDFGSTMDLLIGNVTREWMQ